MEKSTATSKSKLDKKVLIVGASVLVLLFLALGVWIKLNPTQSNSPENKNPVNILNTITNKTYVCNDYFGMKFEVVYNDKELVSVHDSTGASDIEKERKLLKDTYKGDVDVYINTVKGFCKD